MIDNRSAGNSLANDTKYIYNKGIKRADVYIKPGRQRQRRLQRFSGYFCGTGLME